MPWRGPQYEGELPTLGYQVLGWIADHLIVPDGPAAGDPLVFTEEQALFVLQLYAIDPHFEGPAVEGRALNNGRRIRRAVLSRPKGWGKSPLVAALCLAEALADVVPDGWDAAGEPVGRPWTSLGFKAKVQIVAVSEDQTANTWDPLLEMARNGPVGDAYDIEPMETFVNVPRGRVEFVTSSGTSREGFRPVFSAMDQTESWVRSNGGRKLASVIRRNLGKVNGCSVETPNAFVPGEESVAERSFEAWKKQQEGKLKLDEGLLFDHREAPPETDPTDERSLLSGLAVAYGGSADRNGGWVNLRRLLAEYWDPDTDPQDARRYYLNQVTHATDGWLSQPEWAGCAASDIAVAKQDRVVLGFDGSRRRNRGVTDATALVGCRVDDGHLFEVRVWEQPDGPRGDDWEVPVAEVLAEVDAAFRRWKVVGFYADPAKWESHIAAWEARYGPRLAVKSSSQHPIEWWMTGGRAQQIVRATRSLHDAVTDRELTHCGSSALTRHMLNARRRESRNGIQIGKEHPDSVRKIDAAVAAILAWQCRLDALAKGATLKERSGAVYFM
ncbi:terminase [Streptomyces chumphonensis]|uniref:terminase n=1 Tax=Streptomyces chumphonensis TaxID=1214925 RepID=UPI003D753D79